MSVMNRRSPHAFRSNRERLAAWLMLGCVSGGLGLMGGVAALPSPAVADGLEWSTPSLNSSPSMSWDGTTSEEPESDANLKIPSRLPTETVHSVLGIRQGHAPGNVNRRMGTSIELLPPEIAVAPAPAPPAPSKDVALEMTPRVSAPARLVTRDDAQISGFRKSWQPAVPVITQVAPEMVLRAATPNAQVPAQGPVAAGNQLAGVKPNEVQLGMPGVSPPNLDSGLAAQPAGQRQYFPSFVAPKQTPQEAPQPLRDPEPVSTPAAKSVLNSNAVGSGVKMLAPANSAANRSASSQPNRPVTQKSPAATMLSPVAEMPSLEDLEKELEFQPPTIEEPTKDIAHSHTEGDNEGDSLAHKESSPQPETAHVDLPSDLGMEKLLEQAAPVALSESGESDLEAAETSTRETRQLEVRSSRKINEDLEELPSLSKMQIKPLVIADSKEVSELKSAESEIELKDVRKEPGVTDAVMSPSKKTIADDIEPLPIGRLSQLDATGRIKTYSGAEALENPGQSVLRIRQPILRTLQKFHAQTEHADSRSNWGMMHQIMVFGADTRIIARGRNYSAIAWVAGNNVCRGSRLMTSANGKVKIREGTGLQGHQAQFLSVMSLAGVPSNYPLYVGNQRFSIKDLVEVEAAACEEHKELTFTLIGLAHYLDTDTTWAGVGGEAWDFDRLIAAELSKPIVGEACGGTHRLMGFAHALRKRRLEGQPITGQWQRAEDFLDEFVKYTYSLQNRDGSMSTDWYESPQDNGDLKRKVQTTGHMVEFLLTHLPDADLADPRLTRSMAFLTNAMNRIKIDDSAVGYRGHALRSLAMYYRRMYGIAADYPAPSIANHQTQQRRHVRRSR